MSAWLLPDYVADVLPPEARHVEALRRRLLDAAASHGYELVIPPLVEHLESLLTGTGEALGLQTFKLVDQLSGRTLGVRADTTAQVARIDAHLLGRSGVARLCYCGPVLHTRPERAQATRELLQLGAEIYGENGRHADLEILRLALECLRAAGVADLVLDMADARIVAALLRPAAPDAAQRAAIHRGLVAKDTAALKAACAGLPQATCAGLLALTGLYGGPEVLTTARERIGDVAGVAAALDDLAWLAAQLEADGTRVTFDLADARGWDYYTGTRFAIYSAGAGDALVRGGRYDGVGAAFSGTAESSRPAAGFSLELKRLARVAPAPPLRHAIQAPWADAPGLLEAIGALRKRGEIVVRGAGVQALDADEYRVDRGLAPAADGGWKVVALDGAA